MGRVTLLILATIFAAGYVSALTRIEIQLAGRDLPDEDICCIPGAYPPDTYAVVSFAPSNLDDYFDQGKTSVISDSNNPNWPEVFSFNVADSNSTARLKVVLWDSDLDDDDYMGFAEVNISELLTSFGHSVTRTLTAPKGNGQLIVDAKVNGTLFRFPVNAKIATGRHLNYKSLLTRKQVA